MVTYLFSVYYLSVWINGFEANNVQLERQFPGGRSSEAVITEAAYLSSRGFKVPNSDIFIPGHRVTHVMWRKVK